MNLEQIEQAIQDRIAFLMRTDGSTKEELEAYRILAQVKQAQASERIADALEHFKRHGIGIEHIP